MHINEFYLTIFNFDIAHKDNIIHVVLMLIPFVIRDEPSAFVFSDNYRLQLNNTRYLLSERYSNKQRLI